MNTPVATYPKIDTLYPRFADGPLKGKVNVEAGFRSPDFAAVKSWRLTEKIDGQNIRVCYWPASGKRDFRGRSEPTRSLGVCPKTLDYLRVSAIFISAI